MRALLMAGAVTFCGALAHSNVRAAGLPEPGLVLYGTLSSTPDNVPVTSGSLIWTNSVAASPSAKAVVQATLVSINGQSFYIARVPFETRSIGVGAPVVLTPTPNTFELIKSGVTYLRSAFYISVDASLHVGAALTPPASASYTFGGADRGKVERVDLTVAGVDAFAAWLSQYPGLPANQRGRNDDPDQDGVSNYNEFLAGTDPSNSTSFLHLIPDLNARVVAGNFTGIAIIWNSVPGKSYSVQRSTDLSKGFVSVGSVIKAANGETRVTDADATAAGPYFYRILLNP